MTTALEAAKQHLAALAGNHLPHGEKPSAFHHGLITTLVAEVERLKSEDEVHWKTRRSLLADRERLEAENENLPCGHRKRDCDDSYGGCVMCQSLAALKEEDDEVVRLQVEIEWLRATRCTVLADRERLQSEVLALEQKRVELNVIIGERDAELRERNERMRVIEHRAQEYLDRHGKPYETAARRLLRAALSQQKGVQYSGVHRPCQKCKGEGTAGINYTDAEELECEECDGTDFLRELPCCRSTSGVHLIGCTADDALAGRIHRPVEREDGS